MSYMVSLTTHINDITVQDLVTRGEGWVRDVVLIITDSEVIMKEDASQVMSCLLENFIHYI